MNETLAIETAIENYSAFYENLSPANLDELDTLCAEDVFFKDPFNELRSRKLLKRVFLDMFEKCENYSFDVHSIYYNANPDSFILKWTFKATLPKLGDLDFDGLSEVSINEEGKVISHVDYWDSGSYFYPKIPVLKQLIRFVRSKLQIK
ncbi:nuclear transport factor 2 family protein [Sneathiella glossodoripedis]|uniref:nuclear transport factor 2 family protein n=1 Tax=Sneathiella glossodoripedis TaxID=418853 RepID=UPI00046E8226|nr:nuclear transport factor 2 family protein [Sneathiella glossodoripedis]